MVTATPIVGVQIVVYIDSSSHRELRYVFDDGEIHAVGHEFGSDFSRYGQKAFYSGDGCGEVGIVFTAFSAVEHESSDFVLEGFDQRVGH